jgi:hypothetical protein
MYLQMKSNAAAEKARRALSKNRKRLQGRKSLGRAGEGCGRPRSGVSRWVAELKFGVVWKYFSLGSMGLRVREFPENKALAGI